MKIREISLIIIAFLVQCCGIFPSQKSFIIKNQYGRIQLKEMKFKESFDKSKIDLVDLNVIYYYHRENTNINIGGHLTQEVGDIVLETFSGDAIIIAEGKALLQGKDDARISKG